MLACVGTWRNQNVRQREQFMQGLVPVAIIARVKNLDDLIEAHQEIQGSNGGIATANALRLLHVQAAIKQHPSGSWQVALHISSSSSTRSTSKGRCTFSLSV